MRSYPTHQYTLIINKLTGFLKVSRVLDIPIKNALMNTYASPTPNLSPTAGTIYDHSTLINVTREGRLFSIVAGAWAIGNAISHVDKKPVRSLVKLLAGGYLLYRGISGNCMINAIAGKRPADHHTHAVNIRASLTIQNPKEEVYYFWRQLSNLPVFMKHLASVKELDSYNSHWTAKGPGGIGTLEWDAQIVKEIPGELLGWRSMPGSEISTAGRVTFKSITPDSTEIDVMITYRPPAGHVGAGLAWLLNSAFERMIYQDIKRFKYYMETGETAS
jgi:uncharacterized membrane protein